MVHSLLHQQPWDLVSVAPWHVPRHVFSQALPHWGFRLALTSMHAIQGDGLPCFPGADTLLWGLSPPGAQPSLLKADMKSTWISIGAASCCQRISVTLGLQGKGPRPVDLRITQSRPHLSHLWQLHYWEPAPLVGLFHSLQERAWLLPPIEEPSGSFDPSREGHCSSHQATVWAQCPRWKGWRHLPAHCGHIPIACGRLGEAVIMEVLS